VKTDEYAAGFGYQWNKYDRLQLDDSNNSSFSAERFHQITGWLPEELKDRLVLDAGCGAGRFAKVVADQYRARLCAFDLSAAVDACKRNLHSADSLVCQASIYNLPFRERLFDYVYCIGVIQHTPSPRDSIRALCRLVKPGGRIGLWIYELNWKCFVGTAGFKYALRPLTSRLSKNAQVRFSEGLVKLWYPLVRRARRWGFPGKVIMRCLPVASAHVQSVNLTEEDFRNWVFLDTIDMYSPAYDKPQRFSTISRLLEDEGFVDIKRHPHGAISVTAVLARHG
jgi:SAM-dependent methyltransferase